MKEMKFYSTTGCGPAWFLHNCCLVVLWAAIVANVFMSPLVELLRQWLIMKEAFYCLFVKSL